MTNEASAAARGRICVVDDDLAFRDLCHRILGPEGFECHLIESPDELFSCLNEVEPDLIMLDLWMRGQADSGVETLRDLKASREYAAIPVLVCTAASEMLARHAQLLDDLGCATLEKPFDIDDLLMAIDKCLEEAQKPA